MYLCSFLFLSLFSVPCDVVLPPPAGGCLSERADRRLSRQHSQQSLTHSQTQSVSSLTSDLWDRSSNETPGIFARVVFLTQTQNDGDTLLFVLEASNPRIKLTRVLSGLRCLTFTAEEALQVNHTDAGRTPHTLSLSLSLCVSSSLSSSSSPSRSVSSGRPDAAAAAVPRLHAPDQHVVRQIRHLPTALGHHGNALFHPSTCCILFKVHPKSDCHPTKYI